MRTVDFSYRLPVTYLRATGSVTTTTDVDGTATTEYKVAVTTELGADLRTRCAVSIDERTLATQKATWSLTTDGRLTGADLSLTAEPWARWRAGLKVGAMVAGYAAPALLAAGPPGWAGLAALAGAATLGGAAIAGGGSLRSLVDDTGVGREAPEGPADAAPGEWGVHPTYVAEHPADAQRLANLRECLTVTANAHARALRASSLAEDAADQEAWDARAARLQRLLGSASVAAARAEHAYATWLAATTTVTVTQHDVRLTVDQLPTLAELRAWASAGDGMPHSEWVSMVADLRVAVCVDLEPSGDDDVSRGLTFAPGKSHTQVHYRPPRPAILRVFTATPTDDGHYDLEPAELRRVAVACPGNETVISIETAHDVTNAVAVTFDESGALTKVVTDLKDRTVQRAADLSEAVGSIGEAVTAGKDLREALAPPSLVDRAAEAKAAAELGLVPATEDPLKDLKAQLAEAQLRAQLRLAEQIQASTSVPVLVTLSASS